jgi:hypothetical protein
MGKIVKADAWCNGEVAYLAWQADGPIADCLGFMITRVRETGPKAGRRRILPTWIAFRDQSNPDWLDQDSSVWPIQSYEWRDLTLRRSRDSTSVRPIDFKVHYEIVPVGPPGPGRKAVPTSSTAVYRDADGKPRYRGTPLPLALLADPVETPTIDVTHSYPRGGGVQATYTNGILSTQNLLQQLEDVQEPKPQGVAAGPATDISKGLLTTLKEHIPEPGDRIRKFLTADVLGFLLSLIDRTEKDGGELYLALYELHDPELIARLTKLTKAGKAHVILSTAGSVNLTPKTKPPTKPRRPDVWDTENHDARAGLHAASAGTVQDRLFNNSSHIGHNKFAVYVKGGVAKAVLSGTTNWTETGLCTQSNNAILIEDDKLASIYLEYWKRLQADVQPAGVPLQDAFHGSTAVGFARNSGVQGAVIRAANLTPAPPVQLTHGGGTVEVFFSPNTKAKTRPRKKKPDDPDPPTPPDLSRVYSLMEQADHAILFLVFLPGVGGVQNVIGPAAKLAAANPKLLVQGAISDPDALPPRQGPTEYTKPNGSKGKLPAPAVWWPAGDDSRIAMVRAAAVPAQTGDLRKELLSAGFAIIHDKIVVIDPLDPQRCTVVTGSHNLGFKASYQNDENLLVIRGNQSLAISYAVHVLDVYDHYVMRARLADKLRESLIKTGKPPPVKTGGFLDPDPAGAWQKKWFKPGRPPTSRDYFLGD